MPTIYQTITIALLAAFLILLSDKTGYKEQLQNWCDSHKLEKIAIMLQCDFCFSFWSAVFLSALFAVFTFNVSWLFVPIFSTPITRYIL